MYMDASNDKFIWALLTQLYMLDGIVLHFPETLCSQKFDATKRKWSTIINGAYVIYCVM